MPSNHLILCHPLLLLPSIFSSIRVFSNESVLHIMWPKYWSFGFSISPSNECSGLISFRIDYPHCLTIKPTAHGVASVSAPTYSQVSSTRLVRIKFNWRKEASVGQRAVCAFSGLYAWRGRSMGPTIWGLFPAQSSVTISASGNRTRWDPEDTLWTTCHISQHCPWKHHLCLDGQVSGKIPVWNGQGEWKHSEEDEQALHIHHKENNMVHTKPGSSNRKTEDKKQIDVQDKTHKNVPSERTFE